MNKPPPPIARPVTLAVAVAPHEVVPVARGLAGSNGTRYVVVKTRTEPCAIASAICGLTGIIPIASQLIGLTLGVMSLIRIRRAKRVGTDLAGKGWAITGIVSSGFMLVGWIGFAAVMILLSSSILDSAGVLDSLLQPPS